MSEFQPFCQNCTPGLINRSWRGWHHYQVCPRHLSHFMLLVASLILMFPVEYTQKAVKFKNGLESCAFDLISPDDVLYTLYLTITTFFFLFTTDICSLNFMFHVEDVSAKQEKRKLHHQYPLAKVMRLNRMVLPLISVFVISTAPFHVIQIMNLQASQPTLTFYIISYISICLSYTSSRVNPFLYLLLHGNFQKDLQQYTSTEVRMVKQNVNIIEYTLKSRF
ncbi:LOW QUALITY PROTEIN: melanin-concentrating hormone receptor 2 [Acridotheres tristis]